MARVIPQELRAEMALDPYYSICAKKGRFDHVCSGRITWEHAVIYASNKVQKKWAIIPLCEFAHSVNTHQDGGDLNKEINLWIAVNRATDDELRAISKAMDYIHHRAWLNAKYGVYVVPKIPLAMPLPLGGRTPAFLGLRN